MRPIVLACLALSVAAPAAPPAAAQPGYDPQAEAARTRAELARWGARADAEAAAAQAEEARTQLTLRRIEAARARPRPGPQASDPQAAVLMAGQQAAAAEARSADAAMRELDAELRAMDAFLDSARPK